MTKTWLVTGASSGLGTAIAEVALRSGHRVLATARNTIKAAQENSQIERLGGTWIEIDVTRVETAKEVESAIREAGGVIDVVVNNAGYSLLGSIEDMSEEEIEMQFSTNVYGPVRVLKGVLPYMREQRSGVIVNVSSIAGMDGVPSCAMEGDPMKAAQRIFEVVTGTGMGAGKEDYLRLMLGPDCHARFQKKTHALQENLDQMKEISHSTSY
ncbi:short-chain dehydrogenase/reductase SDR [Penicillium maclennaniae]|uniref:short-chain dehydrogenase/reductase SDR n=1 Tax=Penicillium maclennaniae TaxID=1343394 RepID=UPI002540B56E|nr:short-chain dehydrogenase/reductase SDR [Penicillium maclennaniae]KAJ5675215.1 short-chain dehydrogenase/reductase SDR [Penicillium maclennaniae]